MFNVKKLNAISTAIYDKLPKADYLVSSHIEDAEADAFLVRSANCLDMPLSSRNLAFARAGAGVNNLPIDRCTEKGIVVFNKMCIRDRAWRERAWNTSYKKDEKASAICRCFF